MGLNIWFKEDIANALLAAEEACRTTVSALGASSDYTRGYEEGFMAAIATLATAFGVKSRVGKIRVYLPEEEIIVLEP